MAKPNRRRDAGAGERARSPRNATGAGSKRGLRLALLALYFSALCAAVYSVSLHAPFYFDDHRNIVHNPIVRDLSWFARPWTIAESGADSFHIHAFKTRFVTHLTFALNYRFGGLDVTGYHVVNVALHFLSALLVGLSLRRALRLPAFESSALAPDAEAVAIVAAGLFALHPIQTEAVIYTVQRAAVLAGCLCLLSFWCYLRALSSSGRARFGWVTATLAALGAASLSKQNAVAFPLVLALFDLLFVERSRRARMAWLAAPAAALLIVPVQQLYLVVRSVGAENLLARATTLAGGVGRFDYLLTETRVVVRYLGLLLFPVGQTLEHDVAWSRSLAEPAVLGSAALLVGLVGTAIWLTRAPGRDPASDSVLDSKPDSVRDSVRDSIRDSRRDPAWRLVGFGVLWFFLCLAVESSLIPIPDAMLEHRLYLPSVGFFYAISLAVLLIAPARGRPGRRRARLAALAAAATLLAGVTLRRNEVWADQPRFWAELLAKSPRKARVLYNVGLFELERDHATRGRELLERAVAADPGYAAAWIWLGHLARRESDFERAIAAYRRAAAADPSNWATLVDLRIVLLRRGELAEAERIWRETTRLAGSETAVVELLRRTKAEWAIPAELQTKTP